MNFQYIIKKIKIVIVIDFKKNKGAVVCNSQCPINYIIQNYHAGNQ